MVNRQLLLEIIRRQIGDRLRPQDLLFEKQEQFFLDPAPIKTALCTRRAGKTVGSGAILYDGAAVAPYSMNPYIALTRDSARRIMWPVLCQMKDKLGIKADLKEATLTIELENKAQIFCVGADSKNFIERLKGIKIKRAVIDESASFKSHLEQLVDEVLEPATMDLKGQIAMIGTPGVRPSGYFYEATTKNRVPCYRWSLHDNPFIPDSREYVRTLKERKGWTDSNPTYRREYLGEWVLDLDALVYKFNPERNAFSGFTEEQKTWPWYHVLGIDFGYSPDPCAFVIIKYSPESPNLYVIHAEKHLEMTPSDIAERTHELIKVFNPTNIVADTGGLGKSIAAELVKRYGIAVKPAEKKEKLAAQQLLNGDFIDGKLYVLETLEDLIHQYSILTYGDNGMEDSSIPNDLCDAVLYAYREAHHYSYKPKQPKISRDSDEFMQQYWKAEADKIERSKKRDPFSLIDD